MIRKRPVRLVTALTAAALVGAMAAAAPVGAGQPGWQFLNVTKLPATVADGGVAGFSFRIYNGGKSNISALYLTDTVVASPVYFWNSRGTVCQTTPDLRCSFGALNSLQWIDVVIAYRVGTSDFSNTFRLDSTGDPAGNNNSHGDTKTLNVTTNVRTDANFDGGFATDDQAYETLGSLGRNNKQTTKVEITDSLIPVTVEDKILNYPCTSCSNLIGEWSVLNVNDGDNTDPIKVTIFIWGGSVPGGVGEDDIYLLHADGSGGYTTITQDGNACNASPPTNADCIESVDKVGNNFKVVAWLAHNGGLRGGY